jgi:hypothetical protein
MTPSRVAGTFVGLASLAMLAACGGGGAPSTVTALEQAQTVDKVKVTQCQPTDRPETALQGQVPAALRQSGFEGFNCNLELVAQHQGEGGNWSSATFTDRNGNDCVYHASAVPNAARQHPGVPVIDVTNPSAPVRTTSLTTPAMLDPWESLRVNNRRQLLVADNGQNGGGGPEIDVYDLSGDCRMPQLLASVAVGSGADGGVPSPEATIGHEGNIAPDGLTYYIGNTRSRLYHAIDLTIPSKPKMLATFDMKTLGLATHGLSVSTDGNRMYGVTPSIPAAGDVANPDAVLRNGFVVLDTSEVQARKPNAQIRHVSTTLFKDGSVAQHTIPVKINGRPYLVMVDEGGSGGLANAANAQAACDAGLAPFPMARIYDMRDETQPRIVSKLGLETHDIKNCAQVIPDIEGLNIFTYGSHYCSVDNRENATALACSYFNSGIRVFDIRHPAKPKEIAYYNPASATGVPGSSHFVFNQWREGGPDWCASRLDFDFAKKRLTTMCQDNGALVLKFAPGTWPFRESTPSRDQS